MALALAGAINPSSGGKMAETLSCTPLQFGGNFVELKVGLGDLGILEMQSVQGQCVVENAAPGSPFCLSDIILHYEGMELSTISGAGPDVWGRLFQTGGDERTFFVLRAVATSATRPIAQSAPQLSMNSPPVASGPTDMNAAPALKSIFPILPTLSNKSEGGNQLSMSTPVASGPTDMNAAPALKSIFPAAVSNNMKVASERNVAAA
ncbi:hypothetical protein ACHAXT_012104, partial [Thalassiosira profunda]